MTNFYNGTSASDLFWGTDENDVFIGNGGSDMFFGGGGNDIFHMIAAGGAVAFGGAGNDTYVIGAAGIGTIDPVGDGIDTFVCGLSATLPFLSPNLQIENLVLVGSATSGIGNSLANIIRGNLVLSSTLEGMNGNDTLYGASEADILYGRNQNDLLIGGGNGDTLVGGAGVDTAGYGTALTGVSASLIAPASNTGDAAGDTYTEIENLAGSAFADQLTGNSAGNGLSGAAGNDALAGGGGNDLLQGGAGNDVLNGGLGRDTLFGGGNRDAFVFNVAATAANRDTISDYNAALDTLRLDNAVFTTIGGVGTLSAAKFWKSASGLAHDANDRVIYETDTGKLFYDSNGNAAGGRVQIAVLSNHAAITHADIFVI
jgi:serralysin